MATNTALVSEITAEIKELDRKLTAITAEVSTLDHKLSALESAYRTVKESIEKEKDVNREAEKALFRIVAEQNELRGIFTAISAHEERLRVEETNFKNEVQEGVALVGRDISSFYDHTVTDADEVVANAPRHEQEDRRRAIEKIKIRLEDAGIGGSDDVMKEFKEVS